MAAVCIPDCCDALRSNLDLHPLQRTETRVTSPTDQTVLEIAAEQKTGTSHTLCVMCEAVIGRLEQLKRKRDYIRADLVDLLQPENLPTTAAIKGHFDAGLTVVRLFLDLSKDEFCGCAQRTTGQRDRNHQGQT